MKLYIDYVQEIGTDVVVVSHNTICIWYTEKITTKIKIYRIISSVQFSCHVCVHIGNVSLKFEHLSICSMLVFPFTIDWLWMNEILWCFVALPVQSINQLNWVESSTKGAVGLYNIIFETLEWCEGTNMKTKREIKKYIFCTYYILLIVFIHMCMIRRIFSFSL